MQKDKVYKLFYFSTFIINICIFVVILYVLVIPKDIIILHYNVYFGIDNIGKSFKSLLVPIVGFMFLGINIVFAILMSKKLKINLHLHFAILTFFISLILMLETLVLVSVNI